MSCSTCGSKVAKELANETGVSPNVAMIPPRHCHNCGSFLTKGSFCNNSNCVREVVAETSSSELFGENGYPLRLSDRQVREKEPRESKMDEFMLHGGRVVPVKSITKEKFASLQLDAERILGLAPALDKPTVVPGAIRHPIYLEPPEVGSDTWNYAKALLALEWPVVSIGVSRYVSLEDLKQIPGDKQ